MLTNRSTLLLTDIGYIIGNGLVYKYVDFPIHASSVIHHIRRNNFLRASMNSGYILTVLTFFFVIVKMPSSDVDSEFNIPPIALLISLQTM